jgi:hypothetical protein
MKWREKIPSIAYFIAEGTMLISTFKTLFFKYLKKLNFNLMDNNSPDDNVNVDNSFFLSDQLNHKNTN